MEFQHNNIINYSSLYMRTSTDFEFDLFNYMFTSIYLRESNNIVNRKIISILQEKKIVY